MEGAVAIVLAAGSGDRLGLETPKAFVPVAGRPLVARAASSSLASVHVVSVVVVAPPGWEARAQELVGPLGSAVVVRGGSTRQASVRAALDAIPAGTATIVCHDAARAMASPSLFDAVVQALDGWDGVVPVLPVADTVKRLRDGAVAATEPRDELALAQTPQAFVGAALRDAHARAVRDGVELTDDASALERVGYRVRAIAGEETNFKITGPADLARAELAATGAPGG